MNISHKENTEAQKGHRAAPDFSILAAWRHQGKVASKIESDQKMKWYRENQEAAGNQAMAEKPGGFGKAKGGGGDPVGPPLRLYRKRDALFQGALPPRGLAAKGLRRQGATPPRGYAAKGLCRQGLLSPKRSAAKGGESGPVPIKTDDRYHQKRLVKLRQMGYTEEHMNMGGNVCPSSLISHGSCPACG